MRQWGPLAARAGRSLRGAASHGRRARVERVLCGHGCLNAYFTRHTQKFFMLLIFAFLLILSTLTGFVSLSLLNFATPLPNA